ncbi:zinc knuckle CX2CX4HX4C containing protein [Tanacetum coccineum]
MADNTKCIPKGIVKNLLIKIDKFIFPVDFVILDMVEEFRMPIILGRPLLAIANAKVDIFIKLISLEVGNEKIIFKMRSDFTATSFESVRAINTNIRTKEDDLLNIDSNIFLYNTNACEFNHLLSIDPDIFNYDIEVHDSYEEIAYKCFLSTQESNKGIRSDLTSTKKKAHWCTPILRIKEGVREVWASCNPFEDNCDGDNLLNDEIQFYWESTNDCKRLEVEWEDDLEGIIDYLEPTSYDGFIDLDDEAYKERKFRFLGIPYIKPPLILIEKVKVTRYSVGLGEVYIKVKVSDVEELPRTRGNIATIRVENMEEIYKNNEDTHDET